MKIVLSKDGVKREIETPFAICIGRDDLHRLISALSHMYASMRDEANGSSYGWGRIDEAHPDTCAPNQAPLKWTDR